MQLRIAAFGAALVGCSPNGGVRFEDPTAVAATTDVAATTGVVPGSTGEPTTTLIPPPPPLPDMGPLPDLPDETGGPTVHPGVPAQGLWRYRAIGPYSSGDWTAFDYDDEDWPEGQAPFGDANGALTVVDAAMYPIGVRLRRRFHADAAGEGLLRLDLLRSDGATVYLNGEELVRSNMAPGPLPDIAYADTNLPVLEAQRYIQLVAPAAALRAGDNIVAIEVRRYAPKVIGLAIDLQMDPWDPASAPPDLMSAQWRTVTRNGQYSDRNVLVAWIEGESGFVRTLSIWAVVRREHLIRWREASKEDLADAITAPTRNYHHTEDLTWDLRDSQGQPVAPGAYKLLVEFTEDNSNDGAPPGPVLEVPFTLGGGPHVVDATETQEFRDVFIVSP